MLSEEKANHLSYLPILKLMHRASGESAESSSRGRAALGRERAETKIYARLEYRLMVFIVRNETIPMAKQAAAALRMALR